MKKELNRWVVLVALFITMFCLGGVFCWSVFVKPLMKAHPTWSGPDVTFAYSLLLFMVALVGIIGGRLLDRFGPRYLMLAAAILWGGGWFLSGYVNTIFQLYLVFGIFAGIGDGLLYNAAVVTACRWFPDRKGFATGLAVSAAGIAPLLLAPLANQVLTDYGVANAFKVMGIIFLVLRVGTFWLVDNPSPGWKPAGWEPPVETESSGLIDFGPKEMMKDPKFYLLWTAYFSGCTAGLMIISYASGLGQELAQLTPAVAATSVGVMAVMNFLGRIFLGFVSDKIGRYRTLILIFGISAVDMLLFKHAQTYYSFIVALSTAGFCYGGLVAIFPSVVGDAFGLKRMGSNYGIMFTGYGIAAIVGPMMGAWCKQINGNFNLAFIGSASLAICALVFVVIVDKIHNNQKMNISG